MTILEILEQACRLVELVDEFVFLGSFFSESDPCVLFVIADSVDFINSLTLLLNPCVVLEVVDSLSVSLSELEEIVCLLIKNVLVEVKRSFFVSVLTLLILQLFDS